MSSGPRRDDRSSERGFSLLELVVLLGVVIVVHGAIYSLMFSQMHELGNQREDTDVRQSLRTALNLLVYELRGVSASDGDLYQIGANSIGIRSTTGTGIVCGRHVTLDRYALWATSGDFPQPDSEDSALVYIAAEKGTADDSWVPVRIQRILNPGSGGVPKCFWGDATAGSGKKNGSGQIPVTGDGEVDPDLVLGFSENVDGAYVGSPVRSFERVEYGLASKEGRWWLGRKVGSSSTWDLLAGPLRTPADGGVEFTYYDSSGNVLAPGPGSIDLVAMVQIVVRAESFKRSRQGLVKIEFQQDSLRSRVWLRG
jgi:type II secretory pathway pseudopilin PulG